MAKKVLVVDDDREMLHVLSKDFEKYSRTFSVLTAEDGLTALETLKRNHISLVVVDLELPKMGDLGLLDHLSEGYPEIPAIIIAGHGPTTSEPFVSEKGIAGYLEKPFNAEDLAKKISAVLKKEADGGVLHGIAPGTFLQLMEMEQKTCTIRLTDEKSGRQGVLFFREGEILDARIEELRGRDAAYIMLAWDEATLAIQDVCPMEENKVQADLQGLLLEAMRLKDEKEVEVKEKMTQEEIDEYIISVNQVEVASETRTGEVGIALEEDEAEKIEGDEPETRAEVKRPAPPVPVTEQKKTRIGIEGRVSDLPLASAGVDIPFSARDNILASISNLRETLLDSTLFTYLFRFFVFFAITGLIAFLFIYSTMESNQDVVEQIGQAKSWIKSRQDALTQVDREIQLLYNQKDEYFGDNQYQLKIMELELKISELEDKQDKIVTEIEMQQKAIDEAQKRLDTLKGKGFFKRLMERAKKFFPRKT